MNSLEKFLLHYEYDQTYGELKKLFKLIRHQNNEKIKTIRKLAKSGIPLKDLAKTYGMTIQKVTSIVRKK